MTSPSRTGRPLSLRARGIRRIAPIVLLTVAVALVSACSSGSPGPSAAPSAVALPDTAAGDKAQWVLDAINADEALTKGEITAAVSPVLLEQVPSDQLIAVFDQMQDSQPWTPTEVSEVSSGLTVQLHSAAAPLQMQLSVDETKLINGLLFQQPPADRAPAASWGELEKNVTALDAETSMTVTRIDADASGERLLDVAGDTTKPLGSVFKLYALGAVADAVTAGTLSWDDMVIVSDDTRSLPSGELQDLPSGSLVSVRDAALKMIQISDNTATDLLIGRVGREAVEAQFALMGHHDPALNTPLSTTREFFQLGFAPAFDAARSTWSDSSVEQRRAVLAAMPPGVLDLQSFDLSTSVWQRGVDWFANPEDLIGAHLALQRKAAIPGTEPVREILAANPGLKFDTDVYPYVAFKGGSAPGVLAGTWLLERVDGARFVITLQSSSAEVAAVTDAALIFGNVEDAAVLLEQE